MASATGSSSSLIARLTNSDYKNIREDFLKHFTPFTDFITFDFDSTRKIHKPSKSKKTKPESTVDLKLLHPLAKQFIPFLNTALKHLPNRIIDLQKKDNKTAAAELLDVYKMCIECINFVSPCLVKEGYSIESQWLGLVHCYEIWGKFIEAEVEAYSILDCLRSKKKKNNTTCLPELVVGEKEDPELAKLVVEVVSRLVKCAVRSQRKDDAVYRRVVSLVDHVGPWYRLLDTKAFEKLHPDVVNNLCKFTRFMEGEDACLDGDSVHKFCMETLKERLKLFPNDPFFKITQSICYSLSSMWSSRSSLILDIFNFMLDYITCDCKVSVKDTVNEFLNVVHYCVKGCCLTNTNSSRAVGPKLGKLAGRSPKVLAPIDLILKLYAAGLCFTKINFPPSCAESNFSLAEALSTRSTHSRVDLSYLTDVLCSLASYFHVPNNTKSSLECSVDCKSKHGRVSFLSYLNALAFFCHPYAVLFKEASKVVLTVKESATLSPNIVYTLEAFLQFCDAFLMYFSCKSEMEREKFTEIQNMLCYVAVAALIVSVKTDNSVKKTVLHIERMMSSWWIQLKSVKFVIASLHNAGVELYNANQMKQASDVFELCCRCTWTCIENLKAGDCDWSEDAITQFVTSACSKSAILLDVLHQCERPEKDLYENVKSVLVKWSVAANLYEHLDAPTELVRKWVKITCKTYRSIDAVEFDKPHTLYSLLCESLNKNGSSTLVTNRTIGIILEQELLAYEEYEAYNTSLCQKMQLNITEILLSDVYVTNNLQRSKILIKKGRLLRAHGIGELNNCIGCLSEAISILIDLSNETSSSGPQISHHLALAYCLHALCAQEEVQPNSKVILEDIHCASELWLGIDWTVDHSELVTENVLQLLCCVADLLSIKGHYDIQCEIYKLVIIFLRRKNVPPEKCVAMLWADRRLTHALCVKPIDENAISSFVQQFGATCDTETVEFWLSCIEASQPLLVGFRQKFSIYDSNLSQVGRCHPGSPLLSNVTVDDVNAAASILYASDHITNSGFLVAHLYYDLSESLISSGQLTGALSYAKKALQIRTKLLRKKFIYSFGKQPQNPSGTGEFCPGNESDHAQIEILGSVATEVWPNMHSWNLNQCNLSQWNVLQCYLESILQVGIIHETLGNASIAEAFLVQGKSISSKEGLPIFRVAFASALGVIYCKMQLWSSAETELKSAKQILVDGSSVLSSKLGNFAMINCKQCKISLEVTIDQKIGDLTKNRSDGATHSLANRFSVARDLYRAALKKLINSEQNTDPQPNQRNTRSRGRSSFNRKGKVRSEVESECIENSIRNSSFGCPCTHSWSKQSLEMNTFFTSEFVCTGNKKRCWKCCVVKAMETGDMQEFIRMKWNNHCRRLALLLLNGIGQCIGECSEIHEMHNIFWQSITMLFDREEFCQSYSGPDPLMMVFAWKEKSGNVFAVERAALLYSLSWFSLKKMQCKSTCCDMSRIQLSSLVSWLFQAFMLSREVPLLFQKVSRLLATIFVLSTSSEPFYSSLCHGKNLSGSHWAAFFHQASLGNYFNHQLCENPHLLKLPNTDDFLVSNNTTPAETLTDLFNLLRFEPENLFDLEKIAIDFFQSLPSTAVICISLLGREYAGLLSDILPGHISSSACLLLSRLVTNDEPIVILLPSDVIHEDKTDHEQYTTLYEGKNLNTKWVCPWGCTVVDDVAPQFRLILEENYLSSSSCLMEDTQEYRVLWWAWRKKLNDRLDNLVRDIEESWFGPWKCLLLGEPVVSTWMDSVLQKLTSALKCNFEFIANENLLRLVLGGSGSVSEVEICISQLLLHKGCITRWGSYSEKTLVSSSTSRSPVDSISGERLHQLVLDANFDFEAECTSRDAVILVLDSDVQMLPWENLPVLRKMEVYRMPSVGSISALIKGNIHRQDNMGRANGIFPSIDPLDAFYLLNPSGDLKCSQLDFEEWFRNQKLEGKAGTPPSVEELVLALKDRDLFIYIGHGSGAQYIPRHEIQKLDSCAATLLMGCCSGSLPFLGCYNPQGAVLSYLLAGSPAIIANLWEVTDKDIDRFGKNLLMACLQERSTPSIGCNPINLREEFDSMAIESNAGNTKTRGSRARKVRNDNGSSRNKDTRGHRPKIAAFMGQAREACTLPFLIGAAPVCYGVPTGIRRKERTYAAT